MNSNERGQAFEKAVLQPLDWLAKRHAGFVEVRYQPKVTLQSGRVCKPDFELVYRTDQEHRELIECQSRNRSSLEIADKIRAVKALSTRNRFIFVFENLDCISAHKRHALNSDGVPCLSLRDLGCKLAQIDAVLTAMQLFNRTGTQSWEALMSELLTSVKILDDITACDEHFPLVRLVTLARKRVADGSFGTCFHCEEKMDPDRLTAVPWAPYCRTCLEYASTVTDEYADLPASQHEVVETKSGGKVRPISSGLFKGPSLVEWVTPFAA